MRLQFPALLVVCLVAIAGTSCKKGSSTSTTPSGPGQSSNTATVTIRADDGYTNATSFSPTTTTVTAGGTVTWNNRDTVSHTTTSDNNLWTADLPAGGSYSRQFSTRGTFTYKCLLHAGMTGTINVQ
jgi:plastocyanin